MPWTTFSGPMVKAVIGSQQGSCGNNKPVFMAVFQHEGANYIMFVRADEQATRVLFWYDPKPEDKDAAPTEATFAVTVPSDKHDEIPPLTWHAFSDADRNPCASLFPADA